MALYKVLLRSPGLEDVVLGGRTRTRLARQQLPVFVDKVLTEEERAQRRAMMPTARQLKAEHKRVCWVGAQLQVRVQQPGSRTGSWQRVQHQREPPSPRRGDGAAARADGAGRDLDAF